MKDLKAKIVIEANIKEINEIIKLLENKYWNKDIFYNVERSLTQREKDIVRLVCKSKTNAEIGKELHISSYTVKAHIKNICEKLNVKDRIQIIVKAIREDLM